ncbi:MAG: peptide MFS transporter [Planctomycetota bacterium]
MSQAQVAERGHPPGLYMMFFAELWERFCYYGMRALLVFYVAQQFGKTQEEASLAFGAFTALIYAVGIFGGFVADNVLGFRRSILLGGLLMAAGEFTLLVPSENAFLWGLAVLIVGNGLFKPNISSLVGKLYGEGDPRRDSGFTIFYMGINIGALLAPLVCVWVSNKMGTLVDGRVLPDYRWGFGMAGGGMLLGMVTFLFGGGLLRGAGGPPPGRSGPLPLLATIAGCALVAPVVFSLLAKKEYVAYILLTLAALIVIYLLYAGFSMGSVVRDRIFALIVLLVANSFFWACFEQAGNSLNFFAEAHVGNKVIIGDPTDVPNASLVFYFGWFQSVNSVFIILLAPLFAWLWVWLARRNMNPSIPAKFGLGLLQVGLGFAVIVYAAQHFASQSWGMFGFLVVLYLVHTMGELCLSPVGLSMVTKLAPAHMTGVVMGAWFLSISMGNYMAGLLSAMAGEQAQEGLGVPLPGYVSVYQPIFYAAAAGGALLLLLSRFINRWMHGIK